MVNAFFTLLGIGFIFDNGKFVFYNPMKAILIILATTLCITGWTQNQISGTVYDGASLNPLANAAVRIGNRNTKTDRQGHFTLPVKSSKDLQAFYKGFYDYKRAIYDILDNDSVQIYMVPEPPTTGLKVSAQASGVYEPDFEYVFDYDFLYDRLVIGSYLNRKINREAEDVELKNCAISIFDRGELIDRTLIPDYPNRFRTSPFGELFLEGVDYALLVSPADDGIEVNQIRYEDYLRDVLPWTVAFDSTAFRVRIVPEIPQVVHYRFDFSEMEGEVIRVARNRAYFAKTLADYTMLNASQMELAEALSEEQGFPKQFYASYIRATSERFNNAVSTARDLRQPYTPVYKIDSTAIIFDALNQWIYHHDKDGTRLDSVYFPISIIGEELKLITQDRVTQKVYSIHEKEGVHYIREINPDRGALGAAMKVAHPFPRKVKIFNGSVFYIRHDPGLSIKHLYKEPLNFDR
jgi:hypothetical protein